MIDFETSAVAVPFYQGMRSYEDIAFQFSHHVIHGDGTIEHMPEYLNAERGHFPNFDFVRALRDQLSNDDGSVFRYAAHENTILNHIWFNYKMLVMLVINRNSLILSRLLRTLPIIQGTGI